MIEIGKQYKFKGDFRNDAPPLGSVCTVLKEHVFNSKAVLVSYEFNNSEYKAYVYKKELVDLGWEIVPIGSFCLFRIGDQMCYGIVKDYLWDYDYDTPNDSNRYLFAHIYVSKTFKMIKEDEIVGVDMKAHKFIGKRGAIVDFVQWMDDGTALLRNPNTKNEYQFDKSRLRMIFQRDDTKYVIDSTGDIRLKDSLYSSPRYSYCNFCGKMEFVYDLNSNYNCCGSNSISINVCFHCLNSGEVAICVNCGNPHRRIDMVELPNRQGVYMDKDCFERKFRLCEECGQYHPLRDAVWVDGGYICMDCLNISGRYRRCRGCNDWFSVDQFDDDELRDYCEECRSIAENYEGTILRYHAPYILPFKGESDELHLGVELEIDNGGERNNNSFLIWKAIGRQNAVMMHDGSLSNGFEIVSAPATLNAHLNEIRWKRAMEVARSLGYYSHMTDTCGLHIHVDRGYFSNLHRDECEDKFAMLFANNVEWIKLFSRRKRWRYCEIESNAALKTTPEEAKRGVCKAKPYKGGSHSVAVNYGTDKPTIEIRVFRGTLKYSTFVATLQFVQMFADFVKHTPFAELASIDLTSFMEQAEKSRYAEFINYVNERVINRLEDTDDETNETEVVF